MIATKKYILIGDAIRSKSDGQRHYISPAELCRLYRVHPSECIFIKNYDEYTQKTRGLRGEFTVLKPRYNGDYNIKGENEILNF